ncbi:kynurenine formamidase isoform X6 [Calonectris borealis]|uniref:kynurenine formamidase isoform X6 n=1 Tax=Calonectris borealis TaxID=1323832 RepID=UPI003F4C6084
MGAGRPRPRAPAPPPGSGPAPERAGGARPPRWARDRDRDQDRPQHGDVAGHARGGAGGAVLPQPLVPPPGQGHRHRGPPRGDGGRNPAGPGQRADLAARPLRRRRAGEAGHLFPHGPFWNKDESGFTAPPLVSQGVAVVAVGYDTAPKGAAQPRLPGGAVLRDQRHLPVWTLGGGPLGSHGVVHRLDGIRSGARYQRSCAGERRVRPRAHPAHLRERCAEHEPALRAASWSVSLLDLANVDHFDIIEKLSEESYVLTQVILNMISRA